MKVRRTASSVAVLALIAVVGLLLPCPAPVTVTADSGQPAGTCPADDRFGFATGNTAAITNYDLSQLGAGWYHNFSPKEHQPPLAEPEYVGTIRLSDDGPYPGQDRACSKCVTWTDLGYIVQENPGTLWLIGNEPDCIYQDKVTPAGYARLYKDFYDFLKSEDSTCQVGIGGVVQPTPLRLQYLGMVLDAYQDRYGTQMPIDVWNTHNYVLPEKRGSWGCDIPPGIQVDEGKLYTNQQHDNMELWTSHIIALRQFMADRGYRDRPLVLSEYGNLMPRDQGFEMERVVAFMGATFDWMLNTTDPDIGYPADGNRLVQSWAWYSLDTRFETYSDGTRVEYCSYLFDPNTRAISPLGQEFANYTQSSTVPDIDVALVGIRISRTVSGTGSQASVTISADVMNNGTGTVQNVLVRFERPGASAKDVTIPSIARGAVETVSVTWSSLNMDQRYQLTVTVDPNGQLDECDVSNNSRSLSLLLGDNQLPLPLIAQPR